MQNADLIDRNTDLLDSPFHKDWLKPEFRLLVREKCKKCKYLEHMWCYPNLGYYFSFCRNSKTKTKLIEDHIVFPLEEKQELLGWPAILIAIQACKGNFQETKEQMDR